MARREVTFLQENYYHIYNRGNNYQKIFLEAENYLFFLKRLHYYFDPNRIDVIAYCLMPDHYHVLIHLNTDIDVSNIMRSFTDSYVKSFNNWHRRVGHLFQGDFQAKQIDQDGYLPYLCAYIHLNPVKAKLVKSPDEGTYSDYKEWILPNKKGNSLKVRILREYFGSLEKYRTFVSDLAHKHKRKKEIEMLMID